MKPPNSAWNCRKLSTGTAMPIGPISAIPAMPTISVRRLASGGLRWSTRCRYAPGAAGCCRLSAITLLTQLHDQCLDHQFGAFDRDLVAAGKHVRAFDLVDE